MLCILILVGKDEMLLYDHLREVAEQSDRVLDVGCMDGRHVATICADVVALDIRVDPIYPQPKYVTGDGCQLPFGDDTFDYVLSNQVLEHIPTVLKDSFCSEMTRVLKPSGTALVSFPNRLWPGNPHILPPFFSLLPRSLALAVSKGVLRREHHEYYRDEVFNLSPIKARQLLNPYFGSIEYATLTLLGQTDELSRGTWRNFRRLSDAVSPLFAFLGVEAAFELVFPYTLYKCIRPQQ
jgi:SAM-dependent methyltransferase